jgi:hypothetical protein
MLIFELILRLALKENEKKQLKVVVKKRLRKI